MKSHVLLAAAAALTLAPAAARVGKSLKPAVGRTSDVPAAPGVVGSVVKTYNFTSDLPYTALDFFTVPFDVPPGVAEIQVQHLRTDLNTTNILDWGLLGPGGAFRGWGGGNTEPAIVGVNATSRSYLLNGVIEAGEWAVLVGKPRIASPPCSYSINITLLSQPSLPAQPQRQPYAPSPPLDLPPALTWYAGDFHVHSDQSGDAFENATHDEIATFARSQGLDFVHFSEHNTVATASFLVDAQSRHADILLLPGVEYTTYYGHAGAMFTTQFVDYRIGWPNVTIQTAAASIHGQGGLMTINHKDMYEGDTDGDLRNDCVGCSWDHSLDSNDIDGVEVAIQSWQGIGFMFSPAVLEWWDHQHALGYRHIAPIGGSDDHHGGQEEEVVGDWHVGSPVGSPTTMVLAANLSHAGIVEGVHLGRTAVKMFNAQDPTVQFTAQLQGVPGAPIVVVGGDVATPATGSPTVQLNSTVWVPGTSNATAGAYTLALVRNNEQTFTAPIPTGAGGQWAFSVTVPVPIAGIDRWRAEVHDTASGTLHTITNHIFVPAAGTTVPPRPRRG